MNHPAQPAPEGATSALRFTITALLADERRGCDHKHLDDLLSRYAALRVRCERLKGALTKIGRIAGQIIIPPSAMKSGIWRASEICDTVKAALAQPEDGK